MTTLQLELADDRADDGPAMSCLLERERAFVLAMTLAAADLTQVKNAAAAAGYSDPNYGYELIRKQKILDALKEEAGRKLLTGALLGAQALIEIVQDQSHRDRFKAANALLAHNGYVTEQKITVEQRVAPDTRKMIEEVKQFAKQVGMDPVKLLGGIGVQIVDAEFTVVEGAGA